MIMSKKPSKEKDKKLKLLKIKKGSTTKNKITHNGKRSIYFPYYNNLFTMYMKKRKTESLTKRKRRELKLKSKLHSDVVIQLLPLWEQFRRDDIPKEQRYHLITKVLKLSKNKLFDLCMAHDTSRIIESAVQNGSEFQRWEIFTELKPHFILMAKSRYAKFVLLKIINYGDKEHRLEIFKVLRNNIACLVKHKFACEIVDTLYNDYANSTQRGEIMQELYGNKHVLKLAENKIYTLVDTIKLHPEKKLSILQNITLYLINLLPKGLIKYSIVQHLLLEFVQISLPMIHMNQSKLEETNSQSFKQIVPFMIDESSLVTTNVSSISISTNTTETTTTTTTTIQTPKSLEDNLTTLIELILDGQLVPMLHTRDGLRIALNILWNCNLQKRKLLIKNLKTCITNIAVNEHGYLFIIGLFDFVDDVILLEKIVVKELLEDLELIVTHPNSRKILLYLLSPRDKRHFSPQLLSNLIELGDCNPYTKKCLGLRATEIRSIQFRLLPNLLKMINEKLLEIFVGDSSMGFNLPFMDLGRLVLLTEILIKSAPYHLDPNTILQSYKRTNDDTRLDNSNNPNSLITENDLELYSKLRKSALKKLIETLLVPKFIPVGNKIEKQSTDNELNRNELRSNRHKLALKLIEEHLHKQRKSTITAFSSGINSNSEIDESAVSVDNQSEMKHSSSLMPFVERPEGQLLLRRLLMEEKQYKDFTFAKMIMKYVSGDNLRAWTQCNRSCFILVNLYELEDESICSQLREILEPSLESLSISPLKGAQILYKHLMQSKS